MQYWIVVVFFSHCLIYVEKRHGLIFSVFLGECVEEEKGLSSLR